MKIHPINKIENAIGIANGILHDAEAFVPVICDPPRFIHDSRVYPRLLGVSDNPRIMRDLLKTYVINNPSSTTCFPRFAAELHSACQTGTVALRIPIPSPMMVRPTIN